jgi:hypothetical protein
LNKLLLHSSIHDPQDVEYDKDITSTQLTAALSRNFFRNELEAKFAALWEIESGMCLILPALTWTKDDIEIELSSGVFAGRGEGLFGQFHDNSFIKVGFKYTF